MRRVKRTTSCLLVVASLFLAVGWSRRVDGQARKAGVTVFEGARLITGDGSAPIENSAFLVENNLFTRVGRRGALQVPAGAVHVDLTGKTVMPAMIDLHGHIGFQNVAEGTMSKEFFTRENLIDHLQRLAYHGVGAVVGIADLVDRSDLHGGQDELGRRAVAGAGRGHPQCGAVSHGGHGIAWPGSGAQGHPSRVDVSYPVTTVEEARAAVQDYVLMKPEFIKIWVDDRGGTKQTLTPPLYRAIIEEAHKHNVPVAVHNVTLADAKELMRAGVEGWLHVPVRGGEAADDELIAIVKERIARNDRPNIWMTPALAEPWMNTQFGGQQPAWLDDPLLHDTYSPQLIKEYWGDPLKKMTPEDVARARKGFEMQATQRDEAQSGGRARRHGHRHRADPVLDRLFQPPGFGKHGGDGHDAVRRRSSRRRAMRPKSRRSIPGWWRRARAPISSSSTRIPSRTLPTRGGSTRSTCGDRKSTAPR